MGELYYNKIQYFPFIAERIPDYTWHHIYVGCNYNQQNLAGAVLFNPPNSRPNDNIDVYDTNVNWWERW